MYRRWGWAAIWLTAAWPRRAFSKPMLTSRCSQNSRNKLVRRNKAGKTVQVLSVDGISVQVVQVVQVLHISSKLSCSPWHWGPCGREAHPLQWHSSQRQCYHHRGRPAWEWLTCQWETPCRTGSEGTPSGRPKFHRRRLTWRLRSCRESCPGMGWGRRTSALWEGWTHRRRLRIRCPCCPIL